MDILKKDKRTIKEYIANQLKSDKEIDWIALFDSIELFTGRI